MTDLGPCLCGKQPPCPDHGQYVGHPYYPTRPRRPLNGFYLIRLLDDEDQWGTHQNRRTA